MQSSSGPRCAVAAPGASDVIATPADALSVFDFEEAARRKVQPGHWAYMASGVDDDATLRANREGFKHVQLRPRRLHDPTKVDMRVDLFGTHLHQPDLPLSDGRREIVSRRRRAGGRARGKARNTLQVLSTAASTGIEDVNKALGRPVWYQLYAPNSWEANEALMKRVEAAGCDGDRAHGRQHHGRNSETYLRTRPKDLAQCSACHPKRPGKWSAAHDGEPHRAAVRVMAIDWAFVDRLRKLLEREVHHQRHRHPRRRAARVEHGLDAVMVSNHGGRSTETLRATLEALPEVVAEVGGRIPVFVDGGFRRGTDVFKALALGAKAVGIGRPFLWGLGAFGQAGVDRVLEILQGELKLVMGNCGTQTVGDITRAHVATPDWRA